MTAARRILARDAVWPSMRVEPFDGKRGVRCHATIVLDGTEYRCARGTRLSDRAHDGIHDALVQHHDTGAVRW